MNIIDVEYGDSSYSDRANEELVVSRINKILDRVDTHDVELAVSFVSDDEIQALNKEYRNLDSPTDILSFVQSDCRDEEDFWPPLIEEEVKCILGDMIISLSALDRNCENFGASFDEELYRLLIHGVLHLIGLDHSTNDFKNEPMLSLQEQVLKELMESE